MTTEYLSTTWRFLNTGHLDGATNMAINEAISRAVQAKLSEAELQLNQLSAKSGELVEAIGMSG